LKNKLKKYVEYIIKKNFINKGKKKISFEKEIRYRCTREKKNLSLKKYLNSVLEIVHFKSLVRLIIMPIN